jgi:hypothetical protein
LNLERLLKEDGFPQMRKGAKESKAVPLGVLSRFSSFHLFFLSSFLLCAFAPLREMFFDLITQDLLRLFDFASLNSLSKTA